jgi:NAD(P)-dependent dehydrogenase (short-subunit alcohol dehydrogenase family)
VIDVNLNSVFLCAQAEAKVMLAAGYGKIINTASMSGHISNTPQNQSVYNTAEGRRAAPDAQPGGGMGKRGVRVNSISPGYTRTKLVEDLLATPIGQTMLPRGWA